MKIAIDPGHGMSNRTSGVYDPGATHTEGGSKYEEAAIALKYGLTLKEVFRKRGHQVFMTRASAEDEAPVSGRASNAEGEGCEVFISLHLNAVEDERANGLEVLYRNQEYLDLSNELRDALCEVTGFKPRRSVQRTDLAVLKFDGPAVLIELGFIGNDENRETLLNKATRQAICEKISDVVLAQYA